MRSLIMLHNDDLGRARDPGRAPVTEQINSFPPKFMFYIAQNCPFLRLFVPTLYAFYRNRNKVEKRYF